MLRAAFRGEDSEDADMGWVLLAEGLDHLRICAGFLIGIGGGKK
jgi:hypothetical protein